MKVSKKDREDRKGIEKIVEMIAMNNMMMMMNPTNPKNQKIMNNNNNNNNNASLSSSPQQTGAFLALPQREDQRARFVGEFLAGAWVRHYTFATNDVDFIDPTGVDHDALGVALKKALYNYMHGIGLDEDVRSWFGPRTPRSRVPRDRIARALAA